MLGMIDKTDNTYLDANVILRYVLEDIEEQFKFVKHSIENEHCVTALETIAEVVYVLEGVYGVPRLLVSDMLRKLSTEVKIYNADILLRALEVYDGTPKVDFVDCLMYGYKLARGMKILTFDKKLKSILDRM